jgi:hypothetical protein
LTKITAKQIRETQRWARNDDASIIPAMNYLAAHTWVSKTEYRGAAAWWAINSAIHTKFAEWAKIEKAALVERKKKMQVDFAARAVLKAAHKGAPVIPDEPTPQIPADIPAEVETAPGAGQEVPDVDPATAKDW